MQDMSVEEMITNRAEQPPLQDEEVNAEIDELLQLIKLKPDDNLKSFISI